MDSWRYDIFVLLTGYRQFRQTPCTLWLKKKRQCRAVKELVKAVIKLIVQNNCVLLTIRIIVQNHCVLLTLWQCICTHVFGGSPWRDMYHSLLHAILQVHKMFPEAALPTIVPYTDILWARHPVNVCWTQGNIPCPLFACIPITAADFASKISWRSH